MVNQFNMPHPHCYPANNTPSAPGMHNPVQPRRNTLPTTSVPPQNGHNKIVRIHSRHSNGDVDEIDSQSEHLQCHPSQYQISTMPDRPYAQYWPMAAPAGSSITGPTYSSGSDANYGPWHNLESPPCGQRLTAAVDQ